MKKNKSILVIDTPESCVMCPLAHYSKNKDETRCKGSKNWNIIDNWYKQCIDEEDPRPKWCPLSSLPERMKLRQFTDNAALNMNGVLIYQYAQGWNDCIQELLEGEN